MGVFAAGLPSESDEEATNDTSDSKSVGYQRQRACLPRDAV